MGLESLTDALLSANCPTFISNEDRLYFCWNRRNEELYFCRRWGWEGKL